jgi:hypothetical protein
MFEKGLRKIRSCERKLVVRFQTEAKDFSLYHNVRTHSGAYPSRAQWLLEAPSPGAKQEKHECDHPSASSAEVKNDWMIPPLPYIYRNTITVNPNFCQPFL